MSTITNFSGLNLSKEVIQSCIEELGVPVTIRGEALSLEQFAQLADALLAIK